MKLAFTLLATAAFSLVQAEDQLPVASLSTVLTDVAKNVGGDKVEVDAIIALDVDPHDFTPTANDVKTISRAKVVLLSGNGMEDTYLGKLEKSVGAGPVFVPVGKSITPLMIEAEDHDHGHSHSHGDAHPGEKIPDPHWWQSIKNVATATEVVRDAFIRADPANRTAYEENAKRYLARLADLQKWARLEIARLPRSKRILVTSHDAFGYFARDYGFTVYPIEGINTDDQPSSKKVRTIIDAIKAGGVKSIFLENIQNPKVLTEITRETGAKNGGELYADGLGLGADTYEKMIRHNYSTIVSGLE
ncbi:MAG: metal ABC transporter solute-binding protein, Zn/Mn family [Terrimicrobiaceae bacterium]